MSTSVKKLLKQLKAGLIRVYGDRLNTLYLYGSFARGDNVGGSDLDVAVVLKDFDRRAAEIRRTSDLIGNLSLDYEITISLLFLREDEWVTNKFSLLRNIKAEGVAV